VRAEHSAHATPRPFLGPVVWVYRARMTGTYERADFSASVMPTGENFIYELAATGTFPRGGWVIDIQYGNQGINPDAGELMVDVVEVEPEFGPEVISRVSTSATFTGYVPLRKVIFRVPDGEPIVIEIAGP
jgi:hypothetical protein